MHLKGPFGAAVALNLRSDAECFFKFTEYAQDHFVISDKMSKLFKINIHII